MRIRIPKIKFNRNFLLFSVAVGLFIAGAGLLWVASFQIPDFNNFEARKVTNSTKIYDRTGKVLLYDIHQDIKRTSIPFSEMGTNIKNATVAVEDAEFYNHKGIRLTSIARAVLSNIFGIGKTQGGSTITQQLVKNTLLDSRKTIGRKIREWVLAIKIDNSMPKEKILELYLNEVPYGGTVYGIEEAAKTYFAKSAIDLTLAEAAYLAAIPQSPTYLSPFGKNRDKLEERKNFVLYRMRELNFITEEEYQTAKNEVVEFQSQAKNGIKAPHFVFFIKEYLEEKYGADAVENGGFIVTTTLDYDLQEKGEKMVLEGALQNEKDWGGGNAALVAIDPKTGQILSMIGSREYFDEKIQGNYNVATALRQPGSAFKPFIYATAFNKGFTPKTVLFDLPTEFQTTCDASGNARSGSQDDCYMPQNYDGQFRGPMSLRDALAQSINVPAVKLFYLAGTKDSLKVAEDMGISTLADPSRYGLTLVIGGGEVSLLDMTSAYGVFANDGVRNPYTGILKVETYSGEIIEEYQPVPKEILPKNTALMISDILSDNAARTPTFGSNSALNIPNRDVAVKTGTTNSNRDAWTVGYTPHIVVGVWAGNNDNKPMKRGGVSVAGPIWNKFMNEALKIIPGERFEEPNLEMDPAKVKPILRGQWQGNESFFVDSVSGGLATDSTPTETRVERVVTSVHTILHWIDRDDITGPPPADPSDDPQYANWEASVRAWWTRNGGAYSTVAPGDKPTKLDDAHTDDNKPSISIIEPNQITTYRKNDRITVRVQNIGRYPLTKMDVFVNNSFLGTSDASLNFSFSPADLENLRDENEIRVIVYDSVFNRGETVSTFNVD